MLLVSHSIKHSRLYIGITLVLTLSVIMIFPIRRIVADSPLGINTAPSPVASTSDNPEDLDEARNMFSNSPITFEINKGQTDARVKFLARGGGSRFFFTPEEVVTVLHRTNNQSKFDRNSRSNRDSKVEVIRMRLSGAKKDAEIVGELETQAHTNYLIGRDREKWVTDVPTFAQVRYKEIYPGIDVVYHGNQKQLQYDFELAPGASPDQLAITFGGVKKIKVTDDGSLQLQTASGEFQQKAPFAFQDIDGQRVVVDCKYVVRRGEVGFQLGPYDRTPKLIIDPILVFSTYLGGNGEDRANDIVIDGSRSVYVTGQTVSTDFPLGVAPIEGYNGGSCLSGSYPCFDVFITKLTPGGGSIFYSTYLGGVKDDIGKGIAVDALRRAYVVGETWSSDFPIPPPQGGTGPGVYKAVKKGASDAFMVQLSTLGNELVYSTFINGHGSGTLGASAEAVAIDILGHVWIAGSTTSIDFPTGSLFGLPLRSTYCKFGGDNGFLVKINPDPVCQDQQDPKCAALATEPTDPPDFIYGSYVCGSGGNTIWDMALDPVGNVWLTGEARAGYPTTLDAFQPAHSDPSNPNQRDAFVTKIDMTGTFMIYSSYIGAMGIDIGWGIATDSEGNAYVAGSTTSSAFPITPGVVDSSYGGLGEGFVVKFLSSGMPAYSTFVGGSANIDSAFGIAVDDAGNAYITGNTSSTNFPLTPNATQPTYGGGGQGDSFLTKLNPDGSAYLFSTYLGGSGSDFGGTVCVDKAGNAYIAGRTSSTNFPTINAFDSTFGGGYLAWDGFVTKISTEMFVISGRVTDTNNLGFNGVTVTLSGSKSATTTTDVSGNYSFEVPPNGNYTVTASRTGFSFSSPVTHNNLTEDKGVYFTTTSAQPTSDVITAPNLGDALVQDNGAASTMNYGSAPELLDQVKATVGMNRESYLKFDVSNFSTATSVKLKLFGRLSSSQDTNIGASVYSVATTTWDEKTITWNSKPASGGTALDSETVANTTAAWYEWDVTSYVTTQRAAGATVVSFVIKNDTTSTTVTRFNSREAGENMPRLEVTQPVAGPLPSPWVQAEVPSTLTPTGGAEHDSGIYTVSGYGVGVIHTASADQFHSVHQQISGNFSIIARVLSMESIGALSRAGLQVRQSLAADSIHATILLTPGESQSEFISRTVSPGANVRVTATASEWLMLQRNGTDLRGYTSYDGVNWYEAGGPVTLTGLTDPVYVGMVVASGNLTNVARGRFSNVSITTGTPNPPPQISMGFPLDGATYNLNTNVSLAAIATDPNGTITSVEFLSGTTVLGQTQSSGNTYTSTWSNVPAGIHTIYARATDNGGAVTSSIPITIAVDPTGAVTLNPTDDAFVRDGTSQQQGTNFGNDSLLTVWTGVPGSTFETYVKFDTSSVSNVTEASLRLYNGTAGAAPNISVHAVADTTWTEGAITWNNKPTVGASLRPSAGPLAAGPGFFAWDIGDYVIAQKAAGNHTISLAILGNITVGRVDFSSGETGIRPELLLTTTDYKGRAYAQPFSEDALYPLIASYLQRYDSVPWLDSLRPITTENSVVQFQRGRQATPANREYVPEELLIQYEDRVSENAKVQARSRVGGVTKEKIKSATRRASERGDEAGELELVKLPPGRNVMDAVRLLRNQPGVRFAEPNLIYEPQTTVNDPNYTNNSLWNMYGPAPASSPSNDFGINAEPLWDAGHTGATTVYVGVIDTGVQVQHPDLRQNAWTNSLDLPGDGIDNDRNGYVDDTFGWDFVNNDNTVYDDPAIDRHGTRVAGLVAAVGGNSQGGLAASWRTTFIPAKVIHDNATLANSIKAIDYIVDLKIRHGINVVAINASFGQSAFFSQALLDAIVRGAKSNILFIAGCGNGGSDQMPDDNDLVPFYPASYDTKVAAGYDAVISVAAIASDGSLGPHSNYGPTSVDLGAPGIAVLSTMPTDTYGTDSGSSFAAPHVSAATALYASMYRRASPAAIKEVLLTSAREKPIPSHNGLTVTGGILNVGFWGQ